MSSVNKVILIGNLGADPELVETKSGSALCNVSLATSIRTKDGEDKTEWHRVVMFNETAENVVKYMRKGSKLYIEGRLQTRQYEDKEGNTRYATEVVAGQVAFLDTKPKADDSGSKASKPAGNKGKSKRTGAEDDADLF